MSLWVDKYRPATLDALDYHPSISTHLKSLAESTDFPHILVYGPSGAGKKTRIMAILREIYGPGVEKLKIEARVFVTPSNRKIDLNIVSSNYHLELNPADVGNYDRVIVQDLIKEVAQTRNVDANAKRPFKVVVLNEADSLSQTAQASLRRTMEKYIGNMRVIMCCNSTAKIIDPIRSRCLLIRVPAPNIEEISTVLQKVASKEGLTLPESFGKEIAVKSDGNLRKALLLFEAAKVQQYPFREGQSLPNTDWEMFLEETAHQILEEQSPNRLLAIRGKVYELLAHCIPADIILKTLAFELLKNVDTSIKPAVIAAAADFEHRMRLGSKPIFHIEGFVAKFMALYKRFLFDIGAE